MKHKCCDKADKYILGTYHDSFGSSGYELILDDEFYRSVNLGDDFVKFCPWCGDKLEVKDE